MEQSGAWSRFSAAHGEATLGHILVVDDDPATLAAVRSLLEEEGYRVTCAQDAPTALARAEESPPDVILLELSMPIMDGRGFAQQYQALPGQHAPIVLLSAQQHLTDDVERTAAAGSVRKPYRLDELVTIVRRFTAAREAAEASVARGAERQGAEWQGAERPVARPPAPAPALGTAPRQRTTGKIARETLAEQQRAAYLRRLQRQVMELRESLGTVQEQTRQLLTLQHTRALTLEEGQKARRLVSESERLRRELQRLLAEFEQVRERTRPAR